MIKFVLAGVAITCSCSALAQVAPLFTTRQDALFTEVARLPIPEHDAKVITYPWMSSLVDYDNDGSLDTILYGHHSGDAYLWRGSQGVAEYLPKTTWPFGVRDPIWMDVDRDGDFDGIGTEGTGIKGELFLNAGNGTFAKSRASYSVPSKDVAQYSGMLAMPSYIPKPAHPLDARLTKLYFVDLNSDGVNELIPSLTGKIPNVADYSGYSWVYEQQGGNWVDVTEKLGLREGQEQQLFAEDLDMDGDMDLLDLLQENIYRNDGGAFVKVNTAPIFGGRHPYDGDGEINVIDLDNNGYRDLIFGADHSTASGVYLNTGMLSFQQLEGRLVPWNRRSRKFGDIDNDGDIDMVAATDKEMIVYHNVTPNPGMHVRFESPEYFGTHVQVKDSQGKLVLNTQIYQYQTAAMSQVHSNTLHVGGVSGEVQVIVNSPSGAFQYTVGDISLFANNTLTIPGAMIDGKLYWVEMQPSAVINSFTLKLVHYITAGNSAEEFLGPKFQDGILTIPRIRTADTREYSASLLLADKNPPMTFVLQNVQQLQ